MKLTKIFFAVIALLAVACNPNGGQGGNSGTKWENSGSLIGEWSLSSWAGSADAAPKVYIVFNEDQTFDMYQQSYSVIWFRYDGTWSLNGTTLSGKYSDGTPWNCDYTVAYSLSPKLIRLTSKSDSADVTIYESERIPDTIIDEAQNPEAVRSVKLQRFL
jgi:hypothetical protein